MGLVSLLFLLGFTATLLQVFTLREFLVGSLGNEMAFGICLGTWLVGITLGALAGGRCARREWRETAFRIGYVLLSVAPAGLIYLVRVSRAWYGVEAGELPSPLTLFRFGLLLIAPAAFLVGFVFPLAASVAAERTGAGDKRVRTAVGIGVVYVWEAVGSLAAGVFFTFVLAEWYRPFETMSINGGIVIACLLAFRLPSRSETPHRSRVFQRVALILVLAAQACGFGAILLGGLGARSIRQRAKAIAPGLELIRWADSPYQNLEVFRIPGRYNVYGNGRVLMGFPDEGLYESRSVADLILIQHEDPKSILVIGDRNPDLLRAILRHRPQRIDAVDLDPMVLDVAMDFFTDEEKEALNHPAVHLIDQDGRRHLISTDRTYDHIFINLPDPLTAMLNRFYTVDFFRIAAAHLNPGGVLVFSMTGTVSFVGSEVEEYAGVLYRSARKVFDQVVISPGQTMYVFCANDPRVLSADPDVLAERYRRRDLDPPAGQHAYRHIFQPDLVARVEESLERSDPNLTNTDSHPRAYFFASLLWERFVDSGTSPLVGKVKHLPLTMLFAVVIGGPAILGGVRLLARRRRGSLQRIGVLVSLGSTGMAALALEIVFLFAFQNIFGYAYQKIGLVVGLFMFGLAGGAAFELRRQAGPAGKLTQRGLHRRMAANDLLVALVAILFPVATWVCSIPFAGAEALFDLYLVLMGVVTGAQFPLASASYAGLGKGTAASASALDAGDHLGGALGGLITGVILVPVFGLYAPAILLAVLKLGTGLLQLWDFGRE